VIQKKYIKKWKMSYREGEGWKRPDKRGKWEDGYLKLCECGCVVHVARPRSKL